jgi:hypothetical protein
MDKNLSRRFPEIISIDHVDAELLADAIGAAVREAEIQRIGKIVPRRSARDLSSDQARLYLPKKLAEIIRTELGARAALRVTEPSQLMAK